MDVRALVEASKRRRSLPNPAVARELRERAGISQDELAYVVGVSGAAVSRWESGKRTPTGRRLDRYVDVLAALAQELTRP